MERSALAEFGFNNPGGDAIVRGEGRPRHYLVLLKTRMYLSIPEDIR